MSSHAGKPRLVILGSGFAGFSLLKSIDTDLLDVTLVSPKNHFVFTPLLPSTTVGTIEFRSIIESVRQARPDVVYYQASCESLDLKKKIVFCRGVLDGKRFSVQFDYLVIAVGSVSNTFRIPGVTEYALFLKDLADARRIRQRIVECLEMAANPRVGAAERARLLHFVVVGGGPTGVEFAAEMHDLLEEDLRRAYDGLISDVKITLLEASDSILNSFDATLGQYTAKLFRRQRIDVRTRSLVQQVKATTIVLADKSEIPYGLVVWSTGIGPTKFVQSLRLPKDRMERLITDDRLLVRGTSDVYALGDCSMIEGKELPATAQVAQQAGAYLARALKRRVRGLQVRPFRYKHYGMLAYIGSARALADLQAVKWKGFTTWLFWRSAYLTRLVGIKNKILVIFDWLKTFVFGRDISRF